jgi:hypothetical protein
MKTIKKYNLYICIFAVIPIIYLTFSVLTRRLRGPYWLGLNSDPEYAYLLNFLNIINLDIPGHTDHPGTPFQIFGAVVTKLIFIFRQWFGSAITNNLIEDVLKNPEVYLSIINICLVSLISLSVFSLGLIAFHFRQNICLALTLQSSVFLVTNIAASHRVSPEPFLLFICQLLSIALIAFLYSPNIENSKLFPILLGVLLGTGIAVKVTFLPISLILLIFLPYVSKLILSFAVSIISFAIVTLPIWPKYPRVFEWLLSIVIHTDRYGTGEATFIDFRKSIDNIQDLYSQDSLFFNFAFIFICMQIICSFLYFTKVAEVRASLKHGDTKKISTLHSLSSVLVAIIAAQILVTAKHPGVHYLLPAMGLFGLVLFTQLELIVALKNKLSSNSLQSYSNTQLLSGNKLLLIFVATIALLLSLNNLKVSFFRISKQYTSYQNEVFEMNRFLNTQYFNCTQVSYYRSSSLPYALRFGDSFANQKFAGQLNSIYPESFFYNIWSKKYESFEDLDVDLENEDNGQCIILRGTPFGKDNGEQHIQGTPLEEVFQGKQEAAYKLIFSTEL